MKSAGEIGFPDDLRQILLEKRWRGMILVLNRNCLYWLIVYCTNAEGEVGKQAVSVVVWYFEHSGLRACLRVVFFRREISSKEYRHAPTC